jgi:2,5-diketo-D-gluconate reductase B
MRRRNGAAEEERRMTTQTRTRPVKPATQPAAPLIVANGAAIPAIGFGTGSLTNTVAAIAVDTAIRAGYRHIDTARKYGSEEGVGEAIRTAGVPRGELFVTTKVSHENLHAAEFAESVEESLKAVGVDYFDLLLVHWPNPSIPLGETMKALANEKRRGVARHVGVANFTTTLLDEAVALCPEPLVCNQVEFHPYLDQRKIYAANRKHGLALIGYCPYMRGGDVLGDPVIGEIARARSRTPAQVILRWIIQHEGVGAIPRSTCAERIEQNFDVFDFTLDAEEMDRIGALRVNNRRRANPAHAPAWDKP